jgi:SAM-dependent methyltransferase
MHNSTTSPEFFEAKYRSDPDPWHFADSHYEQLRYAATVAALDNEWFERAFEPGCSIGILTQQLAPFCGELIAIDISETAAASAAARCRALANVRISQGSLPADMPTGTFDLIVLSEIGYYYDSDALQSLAASLAALLNRDGVLLAVHWLGESPDHLLSGDQVHAILAEVPILQPVFSKRYAGFRLDKWARG